MMKRFLATRGPALEILLGLILAAVGVSIVFSLGAALIVMGIGIMAAAAWPLLRSR